MEKKHHYFIAVKLPDEAKKFLYDWVQKHTRSYAFQRWVYKEDYHITLSFLGYVEKEQLSMTVERLRFSMKEVSSFDLTFNRLGTFGKKTSPRIFFADVLKSEPLIHLQKEVYHLCKGCGYQLDSKPFRPHITLARKWVSNERFTLDLIKDIRTEDGALFSFPVEEIVLYETHLQQAPKYKEYANFPLLR